MSRIAAHDVGMSLLTGLQPDCASRHGRLSEVERLACGTHPPSQHDEPSLRRPEHFMGYRNELPGTRLQFAPG